MTVLAWMIAGAIMLMMATLAVAWKTKAIFFVMVLSCITAIIMAAMMRPDMEAPTTGTVPQHSPALLIVCSILALAFMAVHRIQYNATVRRRAAEQQRLDKARRQRDARLQAELSATPAKPVADLKMIATLAAQVGYGSHLDANGFLVIEPPTRSATPKPRPPQGNYRTSTPQPPLHRPIEIRHATAPTLPQQRYARSSRPPVHTRRTQATATRPDGIFAQVAAEFTGAQRLPERFQSPMTHDAHAIAPTLVLTGA